MNWLPNFILDLLPSNKRRQRELAEEYFMCLLEHRVILESSARDIDKAVLIFDIERRKRNICSDPNWRPKKWDFHTALYK